MSVLSSTGLGFIGFTAKPYTAEKYCTTMQDDKNPFFTLGHSRLLHYAVAIAQHHCDTLPTKVYTNSSKLAETSMID